MNIYSKLSIFIPTYKRAGKVRTLSFLSEDALKNVILIVRKEEHDSYSKAHPGINIACLSAGVTNLSQTRQEIINNCATRYCMMLDDDLEFKYRPDVTKWNLKDMQPNKFDHMVEIMMNKMHQTGVVHCAVSPVEGHSHYIAEWNYLLRYMRAYIFDLNVVKNFKYSEEVCGCEDFDMALQLVTAGYPSLLTYAYAQSHSGSNTKGGLSEYRDIAYHSKAMEVLKSRWPKYVKLVHKTMKTKTSWGGQPRIDARIEWGKAFTDNSAEFTYKRGDKSKTLIRKEAALV